jgi:peptide/nickel transport system ATP-binding protein
MNSIDASFEHAILRVEDLHVHFPVRMPFIRRMFYREKPFVHAVDGVSFRLGKGEVFGLVGESGCGKTTVGKAVIRLLEPTSGHVMFDGADITRLSEAELRPLRRRMQIIFQDPHASLNPAMTIGQAIGHPLKIHGLATVEDEIRKRVLSVMREVGLTPEDLLYHKYPQDLSGGQKQRAVIARALVLGPDLIVADEAVAMLDMSIRAKVLELMLELKRRHGLTYLFITHDLATAKFLCDRIAIMYLGRIVEVGPAKDIYADPKHPYTRALLQAIPVPDPEKRRKKILPKGEVPDAVYPPAGCRFHPRCPAVLRTCGWEGRDFLDLLEERRLDSVKAAEDERILGPVKDWWARGLDAGRKAGSQDPNIVVERLKMVFSEAPVPMAQAVEDVAVSEGMITVRFRVPDPLDARLVGNSLVECLLY